MANYGKILGSEAFSKGTSYAQGVGAQERAIDTQTAELGKKQVAGMIDFAHKGYQLIKGAQKSKKMFEMLAGSQGYEKQPRRELSMLGNIATLGGAISWGDKDYYAKGEGADRKFFTGQETSKNITQNMYDMISDKKHKPEGGIGLPEMDKVWKEKSQKHWMYKGGEEKDKSMYDEIDPASKTNRFENIGGDAKTTTEANVEKVKPAEVEDNSAEISNDGANSVDVKSEGSQDAPVSVAYEGLGDQNNKISQHVGAPKGGLNDWLRDEKGLKTKAEQRKFKEEMWDELNLKEEVEVE